MVFRFRGKAITAGNLTYFDSMVFGAVSFDQFVQRSFDLDRIYLRHRCVNIVQRDRFLGQVNDGFKQG